MEKTTPTLATSPSNIFDPSPSSQNPPNTPIPTPTPKPIVIIKSPKLEPNKENWTLEDHPWTNDTSDNKENIDPNLHDLKHLTKSETPTNNTPPLTSALPINNNQGPKTTSSHNNSEEPQHVAHKITGTISKPKITTFPHKL